MVVGFVWKYFMWVGSVDCRHSLTVISLLIWRPLLILIGIPLKKQDKNEALRDGQTEIYQIDMWDVNDGSLALFEWVFQWDIGTLIDEKQDLLSSTRALLDISQRVKLDLPDIDNGRALESSEGFFVIDSTPSNAEYHRYMSWWTSTRSYSRIN